MQSQPAARSAPSARGVAAVLVSAASSQVGAAFGTQAFAALSPLGVVAVRQLVMALVLLPTVRPPLRTFTRRQWWPTLLLGVVFAAMNSCLYLAMDHLGLGLAVTLEFLGPLAVALGGSRTRADLVSGLGAAAGVYVLLLPGRSSDWPGIAFGLLAATCWASYILLNRQVGRRLPGLQAPATASLVSLVLTAPVLVASVAQHRPSGRVIVVAALAGLLSSLVPCVLDLLALRRIRPNVFGVLVSVQPAFAALAGLAFLGQALRPHEWVGIAIVALVNAIAVRRRPVRQRRRPAGTPEPTLEESVTA